MPVFQKVNANCDHTYLVISFTAYILKGLSNNVKSLAITIG